MSSLPVPPTIQSLPRSPKIRSLPSLWIVPNAAHEPFGFVSDAARGRQVALARRGREVQEELGAGAGGLSMQVWPLFENAAQPHFVPSALKRIARRGSYSS